MTREDLVWALNEIHKDCLENPESFQEEAKEYDPGYAEGLVVYLEKLVRERARPSDL